MRRKQHTGREKATQGTIIVKGERETLRDTERGQEAAISPSLTWCCRRLWVCQSIRTTGGHTQSPALRLARAHTDDFAVCVSTDGKPCDIVVLCSSGRGGGSLRSETQSAW